MRDHCHTEQPLSAAGCVYGKCELNFKPNYGKKNKWLSSIMLAGLKRINWESLKWHFAAVSS